MSASFVNDGVTGSNPVCGTSKIKHLAEFRGSAETAYVCIVSANALRIRGFAMSDELDWNFVDRDDAKAEIRAAVEYLLSYRRRPRGYRAGDPGDRSRRRERTAAGSPRR